VTHHHFHRRRFSNTALLIGGFIFAFLLSRMPFFGMIIKEVEKFGYFGAIFSGFLFTSTFTVATGALLLANFAKVLDPFWLILCAVSGAILGDMIIFLFVKDKVSEDVTPVYEHFIAKNHLKKIIHTKYFSWTLPVIGALIIASPFPDELGISLMGLSAISLPKFLMMAFLSHSFGIFILVSASSVL
jgi:membrane protein YqaA with SNARE-associated domain